MQRHEDNGVVLLCDFCHSEWDQVKPMIEGHHGSIICLDCLKQARAGSHGGLVPFKCSMCLREPLPTKMLHWEKNGAIICGDCIKQAAKAFAKDPDTDFTDD